MRRRAGETGCAVPGIPPTADLKDEAAELAVLSGLLHSPTEASGGVRRVGLESDDFFYRRHRLAFDRFLYCCSGRNDGDILVEAWRECVRVGPEDLDFSSAGDMAVWFYDLYTGCHLFTDIVKWQDSAIKDYDAWIATAAAYKVRKLAQRRRAYYDGVELIRQSGEPP